MYNHADRIHALRRLSVETGSLACLGCEHEDHCGINGCAIMREAAAGYTDILAENERIRSSCYPRDGVEAIIRERDRFKAERDAAQAMLDGQPLCNAGDMVYTLLLDEECYYPHTHGWYIYPERVGAIGADGFYTGRPEDGVYYRFAQIGKRVFLTRDEAEAALKGENHEADPV